ncbi:ECF transporter S component [Anoxynatronum sibiricum]|uniref:ECF transporter S component n=1 Tax=Anoxynatronum sibiricum TaxID=210623 RepID=A0ABU9VRC1_9CLOT
MNTQTKDITLTGLLIALVAAATMLITIPVPATEGFIHAGDGVIFFVSVYFGRRKGALAAGIGSAMADLLLGYTMWIIPTLLVKSLMGYLVGAVAEKGKRNHLGMVDMIGVSLGAVWMACGYLVAGIFLKGSLQVALTGLPWDLVQGFGGVVLFIPVALAINKTRFFNHQLH